MTIAKNLDFSILDNLFEFINPAFFVFLSKNNVSIYQLNPFLILFKSFPYFASGKVGGICFLMISSELS